MSQVRVLPPLLRKCLQKPRLARGFAFTAATKTRGGNESGNWGLDLSGRRHHTLSGFLLDRFALDTPKGRLICKLEILGGRTKQISPRDATVRKHFYSIDIDTGRSQGVEEALGRSRAWRPRMCGRLPKASSGAGVSG